MPSSDGRWLFLFRPSSDGRWPFLFKPSRDGGPICRSCLVIRCVVVLRKVLGLILNSESEAVDIVVLNRDIQFRNH